MTLRELWEHTAAGEGLLPRGRGTVHLKDRDPVKGYIQLTEGWVVVAEEGTPAGNIDRRAYPREEVRSIAFEFPREADE